MKKSTNVAVTAVAAIGLSIACSSREQEGNARVCVDGTQRVVPADRCSDPQRYGGVPYFWYYHGAYTGGRYPSPGTTVSAGGTTVHAGGTTVTPGRTAPVARGGFGSTGSGRAVGA
ncbi:MAG: hypothetical protein ACREMA_09575 [Longimicrobiales bacterium]